VYNWRAPKCLLYTKLGLFKLSRVTPGYLGIG